jgi:hypothetical protein
VDDTTNTAARSDDTTLAGTPSFDERAFLRRTKLKSVLRTLAISIAVVLVALVLLALAGYRWHQRTLSAADRIDYYADLTAVTNPNTWILGGSVTRLHFPGASNDYASFRLVGHRPVPAGVRSVDFDLWTPEWPRGFDERLTRIGSGAYTGSDLVPELRIVRPTALDDAHFDEPGTARDIAAESAAVTANAVSRLQATPASYTAEVAFSFNHLLTLAELESFASTATLSWGAIDASDPDSVPPYPLNETIGVPLAQPDRSYGSVGGNTHKEAGDLFPRVLRHIAQRSKLPYADRYAQAAQYIEAHGVRYYGAVLTGSPNKLAKLARDPRVTCVSYGLSVGPWE